MKEGGEKVVSHADPCANCDKKTKAKSVLCVGCSNLVLKRNVVVVGRVG